MLSGITNRSAAFNGSSNVKERKSNGDANGFLLDTSEAASQDEEANAVTCEPAKYDSLGTISNHLRSMAKPIPAGIGKIGADAVAYVQSVPAKIVFEFSEGGTINIKKGLSPADYARAKQALEETERWRRQ